MRKAPVRPPGRRSGQAAPTPSPKKPAPKKPLSRRVAAKLFAIVALSFAVLLVIAQSIPTNLFESPASASSAGAASGQTGSTTDGQKLTATGSETRISRDAIQAMSSSELAQLESGAVSAGYTVNNSGPIRWPFNFAVPLGDRFGNRKAPCAYCSTFHRGTDFETGDNAPIYAVAAGVVTVSDMDGSLGQTISIDHDVKGLSFTSVYGHMTAGSQKVKTGDTVTEGELLGLTGSTGASTGPHLFLEIDIDGAPIDSFVWMKAHTPN